MTAIDKLVTIGQIADAVGAKYQRVYWLIRTTPIAHKMRVGRNFMYTRDVVEQVRGLLGTGD